jgi:hypothetical protein
MFRNPFRAFDFSNPFGSRAMKRSRNLFGTHTTPRDWKHGARDIPFGMVAASLYVDGTNGSDGNDGESWKTAKKTIQEAVDTADSWSNIFVKSGTYAENVFLGTAKRGISIIGESRDSVIIHPTDGYPVWTQADETTILNLSLFLEEITKFGGYVQGADHCTFDNINVDGVAWSSGIKLLGAEAATVKRLYAVNSHLTRAISATGTTKYVEISDCIIDLSGASAIYGILFDNITKSKIFNNDVNAPACIYMEAGATNNSIFHNNMINPTDLGTNNSLFENFYSGHSNIDNGFGIATVPFTFTSSAEDPRPVICRDGWLGLSWADADLVADILADVTGIAGAAMRGTDSAALASVCTEARLAELAAANLPADIDAILAKTDLLNSALGSSTLNDANPSDTIVPSALPTRLHVVFDISTITVASDDFTLEIKVGASGSERVIAYYRITSDGTTTTIDNGSGTGVTSKQRRIDISDITVYTGEQVLLNYTKNSATDRNIFYRYVCGV